MSSDATRPIPRAVVAGHGEFAVGLVSAVQQITGRGDQLVAISVQHLGLADIEGVLRDAAMSAGVKVIFTDLQAGSCTMAARRVLRGVDDAVLVAGVNLPMLLDFVFSEDKAPADAARHAADRGRQAIAIHGGKP